jgi:prenyltransferase beta subunit
MKKFHQYYFLIVLILLSCPLIAAGEKKKTEVVEFDFKKTSSYVHENDGRPDFPGSIILSRNYVYSVLALGETIDTKKKKQLIDFVKNTQQSDGGFSADKTIKETTLLYTDYALETLAYLGAVGSMDVGMAKSYLASLGRPDGGYSFDKKTKESALATTYYAIHVLNLLGDLKAVDSAKTAEYIKGFEKKDTGGFTYVKGTGFSTPKNTYMAVYVLKALRMLDEQTKNNVIKFLTSTRYIGKDKQYDITQNLEEQAYTISALKLLGEENKLNKNKVVEFIKSFYIPVNGGFGPIHGYGSAPDPTYFGIRSLAEIGVLKMPAEILLK